MSTREDDFDAALRKVLLAHDLPPEQVEPLLAYMIRHPDIVAFRALGPTGDELSAGLAALIQSASTFYVGSRGAVRITAMPNGHLHNACVALKSRRLGGVTAFTILALEAEITARERAAKENPSG
jgi:hypothetical protein